MYIMCRSEVQELSSENTHSLYFNATYVRNKVRISVVQIEPFIVESLDSLNFLIMEPLIMHYVNP